MNAADNIEPVNSERCSLNGLFFSLARAAASCGRAVCRRAAGLLQLGQRLTARAAAGQLADAQVAQIANPQDRPQRNQQRVEMQHEDDRHDQQGFR